jgi:hypothetical protein
MFWSLLVTVTSTIIHVITVIIIVIIIVVIIIIIFSIAIKEICQGFSFLVCFLMKYWLSKIIRQTWQPGQGMHGS